MALPNFLHKMAGPKKIKILSDFKNYDYYTIDVD